MLETFGIDSIGVKNFRIMELHVLSAVKPWVDERAEAIRIDSN